MKTRYKFTLLELLIVIAIIAILASMLLPALGRARMSAKKIECSNQFKNIGLAFFSYSNDWDGHIPAINPGSTAAYGWWVNLGPYIGYTDWVYGEYPCNNNAVETIFWCPSIEDRKKVPDPPLDATNGLRGYGRGRYINDSDYNLGYPECFEVYNKIATARNPSRKILGGDSPNYGFGGYWDFENDPDGRFGRHLNGINILYADGHVDFMNSTDLQRKVTERTLL